MVQAAMILGLAVVGTTSFLFVATGTWRRILAVFRIRTRRMTIARLRLGVSDPANRERVDGILQHFLYGFNQTITAKNCAAARVRCDSLPVIFQPFAHEGLAMGYTLHKLFRYSPEAFEADVVRPRPEFRYLYYVGLGFWAGIRNQTPPKVERLTQGLDPLHRYLCFDGYGFKVAFFDSKRDPSSLDRLQGFRGYARNAAYQGVGRALFFLHMDEPGELIRRMASLGPYAADAAAGVGLAAVFVNPDRLEVACDFVRRLPEEWHPHLHLGMCFGLKARSINHVEQFEHDLERCEPSRQEAIGASIRECDRIELLVRAEKHPDGYPEWRRRVTAWLTTAVEYPMKSVRCMAPTSRDGEVQRVRSQTAGLGH